MGLYHAASQLGRPFHLSSGAECCYWWNDAKLGRGAGEPSVGKTSFTLLGLDHLMRGADSLEKTLMLGKIEGKRRKRRQRMRWLDGLTESMDMNLSKLCDLVKDSKAWSAAVHAVIQYQTQLSSGTTTRTGLGRQSYRTVVPNSFGTRYQIHGRQIFPGVGGMVSEWFKSITFLCALFLLLLLYQLHLRSSGIISWRLGTPCSRMEFPRNLWVLQEGERQIWRSPED